MATSDALPWPENLKDRSEAAGTALALLPTRQGPSAGWTAKAVLEDGRGTPTAVVTFELPRC